MCVSPNTVAASTRRGTALVAQTDHITISDSSEDSDSGKDSDQHHTADSGQRAALCRQFQ
jgi:hypothetical protein